MLSDWRRYPHIISQLNKLDKQEYFLIYNYDIMEKLLPTIDFNLFNILEEKIENIDDIIINIDMSIYFNEDNENQFIKLFFTIFDRFDIFLLCMIYDR